MFCLQTKTKQNQAVIRKGDLGVRVFEYILKYKYVECKIPVLFF